MINLLNIFSKLVHNKSVHKKDNKESIYTNIDNFVASKREEQKQGSLDYQYDGILDLYEETITKEVQTELLSFEMRLAQVLLQCKEVEIIRGAVSHREYLIQTMKLTLNTSARCTLALYFPEEYEQVI